MKPSLIASIILCLLFWCFLVFGIWATWKATAVLEPAFPPYNLPGPVKFR